MRQYDTLIDLMAEDGVWHRQGKALTRATIPQAMMERSVTMLIRHVVSNLIVDGEETVEATFLLTVYRNDSGEVPSGPLPLEGPVQIGDCTATLVRVGGGWRFSRLSVLPPILKRSQDGRAAGSL